MPENFLYYGDNLDILRRYVKDETVDLVYLDPPFNSDQNYNVLFAEHNGSRAAAQIRAFEDTGRRDQSGASAASRRDGHLTERNPASIIPRLPSEADTSLT